MPWRFQARLDLMSNPADPLYEWSARYYLPAIGAFSQLDAYAGDVGDPRSLHRYLYAAANPWTLIDPSGHAFISGLEAEDSQKAVYTSDGQLHWFNHGPGSAGSVSQPLPNLSTPLSAKVPNQKSGPDPILFVGSTVLNLARLFGSDVACLSTYLTPISAIGCDDIMALAGREESGIDPLNFIYENHGPLVGADPVAKGEALANILYAASFGAGGLSLVRALARAGLRLAEPAVATPIRTYQTYTRTHPITGEVYAGKTSGYGTPLENILVRQRGHPERLQDFLPSVLDQSATSMEAIRGREQMLIDYFRSQGLSANLINGISPRNPHLRDFLDAAIRVFGPL
jgi:RHS repeat-associated protein